MQRRIPQPSVVLIPLALAFWALVFFAPLPVRAAVPQTIGWQGIVEDGNGIPLQGNHTLTFRLYDDPSAGTLLWEEVQVLDLVDGLAEATLGSVQSLGGIDFGQPLWLGLTVDSDTEFTPRTELHSVPYALAVDDAAAVTSLNGLSGAMNLIAGNNVSLVPTGNDIIINASSTGGSDSDWNVSGNDLTLGVSGNVGVGQANPVHKLDLRTPTNVPVSLRLLSGGSWGLVLEQSPESVFTIKNGGSQRFAITPGGRVGIGTTSPLTRLHLDSSTDEILIGTDANPGSGLSEDLGVRLGSDQLQFTKWSYIPESGGLFSQGGIYSYSTGWRLDNIQGVDNSWDVVGSLSADDYMDLSGSDDVDIRLKNSSVVKWYLRNDVSEGNDFVIGAASNSLPALQINQSDRKSIFGGNVEPSATALFSLGSSSRRWNVVYAMLVDTPSDRRLKRDIEDLDYGIEEVMALRPVSYEWKEHPEFGEQLGLIAQELREVVPEIVHEADDAQKSLSVEYMALIPVLIAAIQDQQMQIEAQTEELARQAQALERLGLQLARQSTESPVSASAAMATGSTH